MSHVHEVRLLRFPLDVYVRAQEHADALVRELTLIAHSRAADGGATAREASSGPELDLPERLVALVEELTYQYDGMATEVERVRDDAIDRGEQEVDLTYHVPVEVAQACRHIGDVFDDADYYCRQGEHLLTLASSPEAVAFRRWYLGEFIRQLDGAEPVPWDEADQGPV